VAAFAQLAVAGRGSNTCVYVMAIFTMCESTEQRICIKFSFKIGKNRKGNVPIIAANIRRRCGDKTAIVTVEGSHVSATKDGVSGAKQNKGHANDVL